MNKTSAPFTTLPKEKAQRDDLIKSIQKYINRLQKQEDVDNSEKISKLKLRIKLINSCSQLSITRITHLQEIFKHYCTHIFRAGKYMTFERLQYEKVHLIMERFFLFIKDFDLNTIQVNGLIKQLIDKNTIIKLYKNISSNARDLSFEQFITVIERLAVLYYDEKEGYNDKIIRLYQQKKKKRQDYEKKKKLKLQKSLKKQIFEQDNKQEQQNQQKVEQQEYKKQENDDLIKQMMNNSELQDPNQQVEKAIKQVEVNQNEQQKKQQNNNVNLFNDQVLQILSKEEKVQLYYQHIHIDSVQSYRKKLFELDLMIFKKYSKSAKPNKPKQSSIYNSKVENSQNNSIQMQKSIRDLQTSQSKTKNIIGLMALKEKLNQKKIKLKNAPIPKPKMDQAMIKAQTERKRRREQNKQKVNRVKKNKQETDEVQQKKKDAKRQPFFVDKNEVQYNQKEISWNMNKISLDQLKLKQFQPQKYFAVEDDDRIFLQQYGNDYMGKGKQVGRNSISVVQGIKRRVFEVQKTQFNNQKNLDKISKKIGMHQPVRGKF